MSASRPTDIGIPAQAKGHCDASLVGIVLTLANDTIGTGARFPC